MNNLKYFKDWAVLFVFLHNLKSKKDILLMEITAIEKTIQQALDKLGVKTLNNGTSTGSNFFGVGDISGDSRREE